MPDRAEVEAIVRQVYAARARSDTAAIMRHLTEHCTLTIVSRNPDAPTSVEARGAPTVHEAVDGLSRRFTFTDPAIVTLVVDGDRAAAHVRVKVRAPSTGREAETELMDLIRFEGDRIAEYRQFCDTALVPWLLGQDAGSR